jgi:hypothetical protein
MLRYNRFGADFYGNSKKDVIERSFGFVRQSASSRFRFTPTQCAAVIATATDTATDADADASHDAS